MRYSRHPARFKQRNTEATCRPSRRRRNTAPTNDGWFSVPIRQTNRIDLELAMHQSTPGEEPNSSFTDAWGSRPFAVVIASGSILDLATNLDRIASLLGI